MQQMNVTQCIIFYKILKDHQGKVISELIELLVLVPFQKVVRPRSVGSRADLNQNTFGL